MDGSFVSIIKQLETMLHETSFLKLILFVVPVSMFVTLIYALFSDIFNTISSSFFR